jgi:hypothetical protein
MTKPKPISVTSEPIVTYDHVTVPPQQELEALKMWVHEHRDQITVLNTRLFQLEERIAALERIAAPIVEEKAKEVLKDDANQ